LTAAIPISTTDHTEKHGLLAFVRVGLYLSVVNLKNSQKIEEDLTATAKKSKMSKKFSLKLLKT
jgi:hypothetical protein